MALSHAVASCSNGPVSVLSRSRRIAVVCTVVFLAAVLVAIALFAADYGRAGAYVIGVADMAALAVAWFALAPTNAE